MGRKYAYLVLPTVLMPRVGFPHCFYSVRKSFSSKRGRSSSFLERKVRERREPGGIFKCRSAERICWRADERSRNFSAELGRWFGAWLGRKYAYLVLPTVLMPRGGFPHCFYSVRKSFSSKKGRSSSFLEREVGESANRAAFSKCRSAERICWRADERSRNFSAELGRGFGAWLGAKVRLPRPTNCANAHSLPYAPSPLHSPKDMRKFRQDN